MHYLTYHGFWYTSCREVAGRRNRTTSRRSTTDLYLAPLDIRGVIPYFFITLICALLLICKDIIGTLNLSGFDSSGFFLHGCSYANVKIGWSDSSRIINQCSTTGVTQAVVFYMWGGAYTTTLATTQKEKYAKNRERVSFSKC